jgi:hypothetical protein
MSEIGYIIELLIKTKQYADGGKTLVSNQGQAMDGYTELAEYRRLIDRLSAEFVDRKTFQIGNGDHKDVSD